MPMATWMLMDITDLDVLNVAELATFSANIDANGDLDVDGRTELDITNISDTLNVVGVRHLQITSMPMVT